MTTNQQHLTEQPAALTGAEWARQEYLAMLGISIQHRTNAQAAEEDQP